MRKINALNLSADFKQKTLKLISENPEQTARYMAHAYAAGHTFSAEDTAAFEPRIGELVKTQNKAVWVDRIAVSAQNLWQLGMIPASSIGLWLTLRATELSQTLAASLVSPLGMAFAGAGVGVASLCAISHSSSKWAHDKIGLQEGTLDITVDKLNALIKEVAPALALLNERNDDFSKPAFGLITAGVRQQQAGEIMTEVRLSDVKKIETYEVREWAPQRTGLSTGDIICHFNDGQKAASMVMGQEGLGRLAIDLHFALQRAIELGFDPDPVGTELKNRIHKRLQARLPWQKTSDPAPVDRANKPSNEKDSILTAGSETLDASTGVAKKSFFKR